jgi:hypothetical protein
VTESASRTLRLDVEIDGDEDIATLEGALLAARASERAELQRRGDRLSFGYGSETARESMGAELVQLRRRWTMVDRLVAAVQAATRNRK